MVGRATSVRDLTSYERRMLFSAASRVYIDPKCRGSTCLLRLPYSPRQRFRRDCACIRENYTSPLPPLILCHNGWPCRCSNLPPPVENSHTCCCVRDVISNQLRHSAPSKAQAPFHTLNPSSHRPQERCTNLMPIGLCHCCASGCVLETGFRNNQRADQPPLTYRITKGRQYKAARTSTGEGYTRTRSCRLH